MAGRMAQITAILGVDIEKHTFDQLDLGKRSNGMGKEDLGQ
jgi:hypothetical protein